jgi:hypothetical protein
MNLEPSIMLTGIFQNKEKRARRRIKEGKRKRRLKRHGG